MASFVALLRAVNVGGTGKLSMRDLVSLCRDAGSSEVRTYIASGNAVFTSGASEPELKAELEARLLAHTGRPVGVLLRTAAEMAGVLARNPFADAPGNRVTAIFLDGPASPGMLEDVRGRVEGEKLSVGLREIYVRYGSGMADSKLRIPAAESGTARNMNTVRHLAEMAAA